MERESQTTRSDEPTAQVRVESEISAKRISSEEIIAPKSGHMITSLVRYELIRIQLNGRKSPERLVVLDTDAHARVRLAWVYPTANYSSGQLHEVVFSFEGESLSLIPSLSECFKREYIQKSADFSTMMPIRVASDLVGRISDDAINLTVVRPPDEMPLVREHYNIYGILGKREALWKLWQQKAPLDR